MESTKIGLTALLAGMLAGGRKLRGRGDDLAGAPEWIRKEYTPKRGRHSGPPHHREREKARARRQMERSTL
jgi:hypothetical protein